MQPLHVRDLTAGAITGIVVAVLGVVTSTLWFVGHQFAPGVVTAFFEGGYVASLVLAITRLEPHGTGTIGIHSPLQHEVVDLKPGFTLLEPRQNARSLILDTGRKKYRLTQFGSIDEVDAWLKEAQVAV